MAAGLDYDVFVCYSRDDVDLGVAARLQGELQRFTQPWYRPRARTLRVFRDQTNLPASPDLWGTIEAALSSSRCLLLVASSRSARSPGVRRELAWWCEQRGPANICIALIDGELRWDESSNDFDWAKTTALSREALERAFRKEPAWIDLRSSVRVAGTGRHGLLRRLIRSPADPRLQDATASLISQIRSVPKDSLIGEHLRRGRQTRRVVTAALFTLVVLLALSITATTTAFSQRDLAVRQAIISESGQLAALAESLTGSNLDLAELFAAEAYKLDPDPQTRAALFRAVTADPHLVRYLQATGTITAVTGSAQAGTAVVGTAGGDVLSWDTTDFKRTLVTRLPGAVSGVAVSADGDTIAAAGGRAARIWIRGHGVQAVRIPARWAANAVAVSPSGRYAVFSVSGPDSGDAYDLILVHERPGHPLTTRAQTNDAVSALSFSGESQLVILDNANERWHRLAVPGLKEISAGQALQGAQLYATALSPTGMFISDGNGGAPLPVWTSVPSRPSINPPLAARAVTVYPNTMAISTDGKRVAYAAAGNVYIAEVTSYANAGSGSALTLAGNKSINTNGLAFIGRGHSELISASGDLLTLWNASQYSRISTAASADIPMGCSACGGPVVSVSPHDDRAIITTANRNAIGAVRLPAGQGAVRFLSVSKGIGTYGPVVWSRDGRQFSILTPAGGGDIWSAAGNPVLLRHWAKQPGRPDNPPWSATLAADGRQVIEIDTAGNIALRNSATGTVERTVRSPEKSSKKNGSVSFLGAAADPAARYVAAILQGKSTRIYITDIGTGKIRIVAGKAALNVAYAGELLVVQQTDGTFEVRSADGSQLIRAFSGFPNTVTAPVVAGTDLAVELTINGSATVFDVTSGQELGSIALPAIPTIAYTGMAFSPDGRYLITATAGYGGSSGPGEIAEWTFSPDLWSAIACATAGHALTAAEWQEYVGPGGPALPSHLACGRRGSRGQASALRAG